MTAARRAPWHTATALVPLALLSAAWTANLAGVGSGIEPAGQGPAALPDGTVLSTKAHESPASLSRPGTVGLGVPSGRGDTVVAMASTHGIPTAALSAYQRAETVMNAADKACDIPWQLIAAIGRVESDHAATAATPSASTASPAPASSASRLAAAVYLCSGPNNEPGANLATEPGQRKSVFRYNHSDEYVDLVVSILNAYLEGDCTSVPNHIASAVTFTPGFAGTRTTSAGSRKHSPQTTGTGTGTTGGTQQPPEEPTQPTDAPVDEPHTVEGDAVRQVEKTVKSTTAVVATLLTLPQAILECTSLGHNALLTPAEWNACITRFTTAP